MAEDHDGWPRTATAAEMTAAAAAARAVIARDGPAVTAFLGAAPAGQAEAERQLRVAAALGRTEDALAAARRLLTARLPAQPRATMLPLIGLPRDDDPPTAALFVPPVAALLPSPGFARLLADSGLAAPGVSAPVR